MAELNTYGDLKKVIKAISLKQKGEKIGDIALGTLVGFIPGAEAAKTTFDFIKAAISKPDNKKTKTWLDKLDIDDNMSRIIDDTIENGFMQAMAKSIEGESDSKPLEQDFNMNQKLVDYLKTNYQGRTVTGIKENKMKKSELKKLIKEEIQNILNERVDELNVQTDTSEEGNKQITLSVLGGGWENNQITLSVEEAKELQQLAKTFIGSRKEISKGVNTKDKAFTQSTIGIKPDELNCIIYRKEGSTYRGYDKPVEAAAGYLKAQQSLVYQIAEEKLTEANPTQQPTQPAIKQTAASKAYQQTTQKASSVQSKAGQIKSVNDLPGAFQTWFDSLGLKGKPGVSQVAIISKIKDTLTKMGVK